MSDNKQSILTITKPAAEHIESMIAKKASAIGFRLSITQTGCTGYMYVPELLESIHSDDIKIDNPYHIEFYVDPKCVDLIRGTEVDFVEKSLGLKQLEFHNPNAESLCGCGESFNLKDDNDEL